MNEENTDVEDRDIVELLREQIAEDKEQKEGLKRRMLASLVYLSPAFTELIANHPVVAKHYEARVLVQALSESDCTYKTVLEAYESCGCSLEILDQLAAEAEMVAGVNLTTECWESYHGVLVECLKNECVQMMSRCIAISACVLTEPLSVETVRVIGRDGDLKALPALRRLYRDMHQSLDALVP